MYRGGARHRWYSLCIPSRIMPDGALGALALEASPFDFDNAATGLRQTTPNELNAVAGGVDAVEVVAGERLVPVRPAERGRRRPDDRKRARPGRPPGEHVAMVVAVHHELRAMPLQDRFQ